MIDNQNTTNISNLLYNCELQALPLQGAFDLSEKNILIINTDNKLQTVVENRFKDKGNHISQVIIKEGNRTANNNCYTIENIDSDYKWLVNNLIQEQKVPDIILYGLSINQFENNKTTIEQALKNSFLAIFSLTQNIILEKINKKIQFLYINRSENGVLNPISAAVSSYLKTLRLENPRFSYKTISFLSNQNSASEELIVNELNVPEWNMEVFYKENIRHIRILKEVEKGIADNVLIKSGGVYLITGGAGGLGKIVAEHFAEQRNDISLILTGRSNIDIYNENWVQKIKSKGTTVDYYASDIAEEKDANSLIQSIVSKYKKIDGVIHSAGVIRDSFILRKTTEEINAVLASKIYGTVFLDSATQKENLDFFILFSSTSGYFGNLGQSDYAYANGFLDNFATHREYLKNENKRNGKTISINWPLWDQGKMQISDGNLQALKEQTGIEILPSKDGLEALSFAMTSSLSQVVVLHGNNSKIKSFVAKYNTPEVEKTKKPKSPNSSNYKELLPEVESFLKSTIGEILKISPDKINGGTNFEDYGIDSISISQFNAEIESKFTSLPKTILFEYQNITGLAEYIHQNHQDDVENLFSVSPQKEVELPLVEISQDYSDWKELQPLNTKKSILSSGSKEQNDDIAIIGMSGRYPGAKNLSEYWENLKNGKDCIEEIPSERWSIEDHYDPDPAKVLSGKAYSKWGGFITDADKFDPLFFNISKREAELMDPQERLFLEAAWQTFEDAGYRPSDFKNNNTKNNNIGVFAGITTNSYQLLGFKEWENNNFVIPKSSPWSVANRISYTLNLTGPSFPVDTACSSSLTAVHMAYESLKNGACEMAIAGGGNLYFHHSKYVAMCEVGMLSPTGKCHSFGDKADGFAPGEGVGAILLKPLSKAIEDNDHIYGVIKGSQINHGGKTNGYTVPNPNAQADLIISTLEQSNIDPRTINFFEAHGTGTSLGDPIEVRGITKAFSKFTDDVQFCSLSSVKANIGHLEAAAGIAGITKILLSFKHKQLVPSINCETINPNIDFAKSPLYIQTKLEDIKRIGDEPFRAGISSFGAGGANAHMILEEYTAKPSLEISNPNNVFVLSAKNQDRLLAYATGMCDFLEQIKLNRDNFNIEDFIFTLQTGRDLFEERLAFTTSNIQETIDKLKAYCNGKSNLSYYTLNTKKKDKTQLNVEDFIESDAAQKLLKSKDYDKLAKLWALGFDVDWKKLYQTAPRKMSLPTYPFYKERCWIPENKQFSSQETTKYLHPLLHANTSNLDKVQFESKFLSSTNLSFKLENEKLAFPHELLTEIIYAASNQVSDKRFAKITDLTFGQIALFSKDKLNLRVLFHSLTNECKVEVLSFEGEKELQSHCHANLLFVESPIVSDTQIKTNHLLNDLDGNTFYNSYIKDNYQFDKIISTISFDTDELIAECIPNLNSGELKVHPAAICSIPYLINVLNGDQSVSFIKQIGEIDFYDVDNSLRYIKVKKTSGQYSIQFVNSNNQLITEINKIALLGAQKTNIAKKESKYIIELLKQSWENTPISNTRQTSINTALILVPDKMYFDHFEKGLTNITTKIFVVPGKNFNQIASGVYELNVQDEQHYTKLFNALIEKGIAVELILHAFSLNKEDIWEQATNENISETIGTNILSVTSIIRVISELKIKSINRILIAELKQQNITSVLAQSISALPSSMSMVTPDKLFTNLTFDIAETIEGIAKLISSELNNANQNDKEISYQNNSRFIKQLERTTLEQNNHGFKKGGVYIVTGGMGGIGYLVANYLVEKYQAKLVLTGRTALNESMSQKITQLEQKGATCLYCKADIANIEDVNSLIRLAKEKFTTINGILHAAGINDQKIILDKTTSESNRIFAPKINGTLLIDEATKNEKLDFFVLFSSTSSVFGDFGQCDYAIANRFLDNFATYRNSLAVKGQRIGKTISINWPLWREGGMHSSKETEDIYLTISGMQYLETTEGLKIMDAVLADGNADQVIIFPGEEDRLNKLLAKQVTINETSLQANSKISTSGITALNSENITEWLQEVAAQILRIEPSQIELNENLGYYGFDSISIKEFATILQAKFEKEISPSIFFAKNTINDLSEYLKEEFSDFLNSNANTNEQVVEIKQNAKTKIAISQSKYDALPFLKDITLKSDVKGATYSSNFEDIAIIGAHGVFPGSADLLEFWDNIKNGKNCIQEIPLERWDWRDSFNANGNKDTNSNSKWAGLIDSYNKFDASFFNISPREAKVMDPQHRIFLESIWKTVEDAGYQMSDFSGKSVGVFAGIQFNDYLLMLSDMNRSVAQIATGTSHAMLVNRASYLFNFHGPSEAIDTACSSSLVAINRAVKAIQSGECDVALTGGVSLILSPTGIIAASQMGILSPNGRCKTFDKDADGYVKGEGVGTILLKRLSKAIEDKDNIYAVIKGVNVNHGGKANSLTSPNSDAQSQLIINTHTKAGIPPQSIGYIEAHGTGTVLGDPVEVDALKKSFQKIYKSRNEECSSFNYCGIGSVKTNIGHLEPAAGIAGVLKVVMALKNAQIPPLAHFEALNPYINLDKSPFYITSKLKEWEPLNDTKGSPYSRRGTVSSFGFGGANAHIILEEFKYNNLQENATSSNQLFVFSAKNKGSLDNYLRSFIEFLNRQEKGNHEELINPRNMAYTLQTGREQMKERIAIVALSLKQLKDSLNRALNGEYNHDIFASNKIDSKPVLANANLDLLLINNDWVQLAKTWVGGTNIEWTKLYASNKPFKISLPTYSFEKKTYWYKEEDLIEQVLNRNIEEFILIENNPNVGTIMKEVIAHGPFRPVNKEIVNAQTQEILSDTKKEYLQKFIEHYCKKNQASKEHTIKYRKTYADQRAVAFFHMTLKDMCFPLVYQKANGSKIWDIDNNEYIDIATDFGANIFGHQPEFLKKALINQINEGWALGMRPEKSALAADLLCSLTKMDRAVFTQSGTEAVMTAIRVVRQISKKKKVVIFSNSYHGHSDVVLGYSVLENGKYVTKSMTDGTPANVVENLIVLNYADDNSLEEIKKYKHELAAVLVEPMQSRGLKLKPEQFLKKLKVITEENGIALIFDEMITGLRTAPGGAQEWYGVKANIATYGKVLGGGLGIGAIAGETKYLDAIDGGQWGYGDNSFPEGERTFFAGTHSQNTIAMAGVHAVLSEIISRGKELQIKINSNCKYLCETANTLFNEENIPINMFYFGSLFRFEFVDNYKNPLELNLFLLHLRDNGIMVSEIGNNFLTDAHTKNDLDTIIEAIRNSIKNMRIGGYFQKVEKKTVSKPAEATVVTKEKVSGSLIGDVMAHLQKS